MRFVQDCIFCKMANGEVPTDFVYQDELVVAFDDINPQAPVHALIVPRAHHTTPGDGVGSELAAALFSAIPSVARAKGVAESGYRVIINAGRDANQSVHHLHIHILGARSMSHRMLRFLDESE